MFPAAPTPYGGEGGIRTHGEREPTAVFKTAALNHSATHPLGRSLWLCRVVRASRATGRVTFVAGLWHQGRIQGGECEAFQDHPGSGTGYGSTAGGIGAIHLR